MHKPMKTVLVVSIAIVVLALPNYVSIADAPRVEAQDGGSRSVMIDGTEGARSGEESWSYRVTANGQTLMTSRLGMEVITELVGPSSAEQELDLRFYWFVDGKEVFDHQHTVVATGYENQSSPVVRQTARGEFGPDDHRSALRLDGSRHEVTVQVVWRLIEQTPGNVRYQMVLEDPEPRPMDAVWAFPCASHACALGVLVVGMIGIAATGAWWAADRYARVRR